MADHPRLNWDILCICKDCGAQYKMGHPCPSAEVQPDGHRLIQICPPNQCPKCKNMRVVN